MGWTCQHDHQGYCKLIKKPCVPGMKGCILQKSDGIVFTTGNFEEDKKAVDEKRDKVNGEDRKDALEQEIDFTALARSN